MIKAYIAAILPDYQIGKVKAGGKSVAEKLIRSQLEQLFPNASVLPNFRPQELRSPKGRPLDFDLWLPDFDLAIEIQGPQHSKSLYGSDNSALMANDQYKREWCEQKEIKLIWMELDGATKSLFRLPEIEQRRHLGELLKGFLASNRSFLCWKSVGNHACA